MGGLDRAPQTPRALGAPREIRREPRHRPCPRGLNRAPKPPERSARPGKPGASLVIARVQGASTGPQPPIVRRARETRRAPRCPCQLVVVGQAMRFRRAASRTAALASWDVATGALLAR